MYGGYVTLARNAQDVNVLQVGIRNIVGWLDTVRARKKRTSQGRALRGQMKLDPYTTIGACVLLAHGRFQPGGVQESIRKFFRSRAGSPGERRSSTAAWVLVHTGTARASNFLPWGVNSSRRAR